MREWLTIIIVILILGILLDGIRRMRAYRKNALRMSRSIPDDDGSDDVPTSEFPTGGARVVAYRDSKDAVHITRNARESYTASRKTKGSPSRAQEVSDASQDLPQPTFKGAFAYGSSEKDASISNAPDEGYESPFDQPVDLDYEPSLGSLDDLDDDRFDDEIPEDDESPAPLSDLDSPFVRYQSPLSKAKPEESVPADSNRKSVLEPKPEYDVDQQKQENISKSEQVKKPDSLSKNEKTETSAKQEKLKAPDMVLVINIMARKGEVFAGADLLNSLVDNGLRYGEMDIFHRHESADGKGKVLFSLANMVMPGVFDLSTMDEFETPGVSMFLSLPVSVDSLRAYNLMAETALSLAEELDGELKDEQRSVMTRQTIEHDRQRVIEYERKKRLERA